MGKLRNVVRTAGLVLLISRGAMAAGDIGTSDFATENVEDMYREKGKSSYNELSVDEKAFVDSQVDDSNYAIQSALVNLGIAAVGAGMTVLGDRKRKEEDRVFNY